MKCLNQMCDADTIEIDDNFCYKCGHFTSKGYSYLKDNNINKGASIKQNIKLP